MWMMLIGAAHADPAATRDSLDRLEEVLELRVEYGQLSPKDALPAILVSAQPRYVDTQEWYATGVIETLVRAFGSANLRICEACMAPRAVVEDGALVYQTGPIGLDEIARLDDLHRGDAQPARAAIWVDEYPGGVSVRIIDLSTARVLFAQNIDPDLTEIKNSARMYSLSAEIERRARGNSITQAFFDIALFPNQHVSLDWTEQWGPTNRNLSGVTLSAFDPAFGVGASHYRSTRLFNTLIGAKAILSVPTAAASAFVDGGAEVLDPLVTVVGVARVPFGRSNYGAVLTVSTNGRIALGISLMNSTLFPVLP